MTLKTLYLPLVWATSLTLACANTAPTVVIQSAAMRPGTTLMDVVYRVNDPDDATVKTRALAFVDGVRSFANVLKPVTFVEGTAAKLGDATASNTNHTLTWDVAADWNVDLGQVKFEVLAMDTRGLLPFDWITIPAAGGNPQTGISKNSPTNDEVLNALFWQYANGDAGLSLADGVLTGNANSGIFNQVVLAKGSTLQTYSTPFVLKRMNLDPDDWVLATAARAALSSPLGWHAANRPYSGTKILLAWGENNSGQCTLPDGLSGVITAIAGGQSHSLALKSDGTIVAWGYDGAANPPHQSSTSSLRPSGLASVTGIAAGQYHCLALKNNGTVVAWGYNDFGQSTIPLGLRNVIAIAGGGRHSLALKSDGTVVAWGMNNSGQCNVPSGLSGVTAIAAGQNHSLALKADGTVVSWGSGGLSASGVVAISSSGTSSLALKSDGTVVGGIGLSGVTAISAGYSHSLALKNDGTVVAWGGGGYGQSNVPAGLSGVTGIAAGYNHNLILKGKAP